MPDPARILVVDDNEQIHLFLRTYLGRMGHTPADAFNGVEALEAMREQAPDLVLLDIEMPGLDGFGVLEQMKADDALRHLPVIVLSGLSDTDSIVRCVEMGADDYLVKPFHPALLKARLGVLLERKRLRDQEAAHQREIEEYSLTLEERVRQQVQEIALAQLATIFAMAKLTESRDPETGEHLERIQEYTRVLLEQLQPIPKHASTINGPYIENVCAASPLHDIGKVGIPDSILQKPGPLTDEEFKRMEVHTVIGANALREVQAKHPGNQFVHRGIDIAESHHECWNGSGYPYGLAGENIPFVGRVLALSDVYDALRFERCYKKAIPHVESRDIIVSGRGKQFDPDVVDAFLAAERGFIEIAAGAKPQ